MKRIIFDIAAIKNIALFERITKVSVKDCFLKNESLYYIVGEKDVGRCIGKGASTLALIERKLNKKIRVIGYAPDVITFFKNVVMPLKVTRVDLKDKILQVTVSDTKIRSLIIGRNGTRLRLFEEIMQRHFDIEKITVLKNS